MVQEYIHIVEEVEAPTTDEVVDIIKNLKNEPVQEWKIMIKKIPKIT